MPDNINAIYHPSFIVQEVESSANYAKMVIEPLEKGFGHTIGNALRRVLLSSLPGYAITAVRIKNADHEFTTIDGVKEDVVELILNIKQIRLQGSGEDKVTLSLSETGAKEVTAADIKCGGGFEIVNKDLHIATLEKGKKLNIEMDVEKGFGYILAEEFESDIVNQIAVDALFSPIVKVSYKVESTRVGRRTDFDKIVLDIHTDGTIAPLEAVKQAANILTIQFTQLYNPVVPEVKTSEDQLTPEELEVLRLTVEELDLPTRIANALRKGGYATVGNLKDASREDVIKVKNLGEKSIDVINKALEKKGVTLKD